MSETPQTQTATSQTPSDYPGLLARAIGIITSPAAIFAHVVRTPKVAGMLFLVGLLAGLAQGLPQLSESGRAAAVEMQVQSLERFGMDVSDETYQQMYERSRYGAYTTILGTLVMMPVGIVFFTAIFWAVFNIILGGTASFKHVMAVLTHSQVISTVGALFAAPIMYARGTVSAGVANLGALLPMLDETSFLAKFLGVIDLFVIWWMVVLAIGLATLYKKTTKGVATGLFICYAIFALVWAYFTAG